MSTLLKHSYEGTVTHVTVIYVTVPDCNNIGKNEYSVCDLRCSLFSYALINMNGMTVTSNPFYASGYWKALIMSVCMWLLCKYLTSLIRKAQLLVLRISFVEWVIWHLSTNFIDEIIQSWRVLEIWRWLLCFIYIFGKSLITDVYICIYCRISS